MCYRASQYSRAAPFRTTALVGQVIFKDLESDKDYFPPNIKLVNGEHKSNS